MNAAEILMRLKAFAPDTPVTIALPVLRPDGGEEHKLLPPLDVYHHGLAPETVDPDRGGVELFTTDFDAKNVSTIAPVMAKDLIAKLSKHADATHVRVAVGNGDHHRMLDVVTVGFAADAVPVGGKLPIQLFVEPWHSLTMVVRSLTTDGKGLGPS